LKNQNSEEQWNEEEGDYGGDIEGNDNSSMSSASVIGYGRSASLPRRF